MTQRAQQDLRTGIGWALFGSAMTAGFMVPWKLASGYGESRHAVLVMLSSAALCNSAMAAVQAVRGKRSGPSATWRATLLLAVAFAGLTLVGNTCSAEAVSRISAALLAVVQRCEVLLVAVLGAVFLAERVARVFWLGTAVAGVGLWLLKAPTAASDQVDPVGALFGLGSAACFGSMVLLGRRYVQRVHLLPFNALRLWMSVALWFVVQRELPGAGSMPSGLVVNAALAGFFGPFLARVCILQSGRYVPAQLTSLTALATPVLTLALSFVVLNHLPSQQELLGGSVMLLGVAIPVVSRLRASPRVVGH